MFGGQTRNALADFMPAYGPQASQTGPGLNALLSKLQLAPAPPSPTEALLQMAEQKYPFINQYNPIVSMSPNAGGGDYAETWRINDMGDRSRPRPKAIPPNRIGVEVYRPNDFGPTDLAAEFLHVDPYANATRAALLKSLSPQQIATLKHAAGDYADTLKMGGTEQKAIENSVDSAMRGYTVGQWPADANAEMRYTPQQLQMLDALKRYMETGKR
jgi:hypothetical protein